MGKWRLLQKVTGFIRQFCKKLGKTWEEKQSVFIDIENALDLTREPTEERGSSQTLKSLSKWISQTGLSHQRRK